MKELAITLTSGTDVDVVMTTFDTIVAPVMGTTPPKPTTPLEELGVLLGNLNDDGDQINDTSSTDNVIHVECYPTANLAPLRALCAQNGWKVKWDR